MSAFRCPPVPFLFLFFHIVADYLTQHRPRTVHYAQKPIDSPKIPSGRGPGEAKSELNTMEYEQDREPEAVLPSVLDLAGTTAVEEKDGAAEEKDSSNNTTSITATTGITSIDDSSVKVEAPTISIEPTNI